MKGIWYTAWSRERKGCGHAHRNVETAHRCAQDDAYRNRGPASEHRLPLKIFKRSDAIKLAKDWAESLRERQSDEL